MDTQMKKGALELCLLYTISKGETYGYDLLKKMTTVFPDVSESTVYAILRRLNIEGYTETFTGDASGGPTRKYYRITVRGEQYLVQSRLEWGKITNAVAQLLDG